MKVFSLSALKDTKGPCSHCFTTEKRLQQAALSAIDSIELIGKSNGGRCLWRFVKQQILRTNWCLLRSIRVRILHSGYRERSLKWIGNTMKYSQERRTCFTFAFPWSTPDERQAVREMPQASRHQWRNGSKSLKHILSVWFHLIPLWCRSGPGSHVNTSLMMILECYWLGCCIDANKEEHDLRSLKAKKYVVAWSHPVWPWDEWVLYGGSSRICLKIDVGHAKSRSDHATRFELTHADPHGWK